MPEISRFFGIIVTMNWREHPPAHFHARYGDEKATYEIFPFQPLEGRLSPRAVRLVHEWAAGHRAEFLRIWALVRARQPLRSIAPLE